MKISEEEKNRLEEIYQKLRNDEKVMNMKEVPMHRGSNCYLHSFRVAKYAIYRAIKYHKYTDLEVILYSAILHDYYLYDWRKDKSKKKHHGSRHPFIAAALAKRDFNINDKVAKVIRSHMWPINIKEFPSTREAKILSYSDKHIAIREALCSVKYKKKKMDKYLKHIEKLFD